MIRENRNFRSEGPSDRKVKCDIHYHQLAHARGIT